MNFFKLYIIVFVLISTTCLSQNKKDKIHQIGLSFSPSVGNIQMNNDVYGFGFHSDITLNYFINKHLGVSSGFIYSYLPIKNFNDFTTEGSGRDHYHLKLNYNGFVSSIGIPLKLILTSSKKVSPYLRGGLVIFFPLKTFVHTNSYNFNRNSSLKTSNLVLSSEADLGLSYQLSDKFRMNLGVFLHYSFSQHLEIGEETNAFLIGAQLGMFFNLHKR